MKLVRKRQKHRINKNHRKKIRRGRTGSRSKGRAWNSKNKNKKKNLKGKDKTMAHKVKKDKK